MYATGAHASEAVAFKAGDIDFPGKVLRLRAHGSGSWRMLPIGHDLLIVLKRYARSNPSGDTDEPFFALSREGGTLSISALQRNYHKVLAKAGITRKDSLMYRPRLCDLRFTFAVHRIESWIDQGRDLNRLLPALAGYLGQHDLTSTTRLVGLTSNKFKAELDRLSPSKGIRWALNPDAIRVLSAVGLSKRS